MTVAASQMLAATVMQWDQASTRPSKRTVDR